MLPSSVAPPRWTALVRVALIALVVCGLGAAYALTLQTHIAGSFDERRSPELRLKNEYIKDVSEIQVALNVWGTIHHTGYPLFAVLGNLFTLPLRLAGVEPAAAASLYALAWGLVALAAFAALVWRLTGRPALAALGAGVVGLARSIWVHNVVAEVYSMSLAITMVILTIALWPGPWRGAWGWRRRVLMLALLGGIGVAHHRAVAFVAPAALAAAWLHRRDEPVRWGPTLLAATGLAALGFIPYIYLPLRAWQGAEWVYGEPGTWRGLWIEFTGREASWLMTLPPDAAGWLDNARRSAGILATELTLPGLLAALAALALAMTVTERRRAARLMALAAVGPTAFAVAFHTAVMPEAVLMPVVPALVFGVVLALDGLARRHPRALSAGAAGLAAWAVALGITHYPFVDELVREPSGVETIARLEHIPQGERVAVFYPWGPRYAAASYARLVTRQYADLLVVHHKADLRRLLDEGYAILTEPETFYTFPPPWPSVFGPPSTWWTDRIGAFYVRSGAPGYVAIDRAPRLDTTGDLGITPLAGGIGVRAAWLRCDDAEIVLHVIWQVETLPDRSLSVFVHLLGEAPGPPLAQADMRSPVYGVYAFPQWLPGQSVEDDYILPRKRGAIAVRFGLYEPAANGGFINYEAGTLPISACEPVHAG